MKKAIILLFLIAAFVNITFSFERITNYSSTIGVYDFESKGDKLYVASSGGLYVFSKANRSGYLIPNTKICPDPYTTALYLQNGETLWSGTNRGYLSKRTPPENRSLITTYNSYSSTNWSITDILQYKKYLFIASNKGISLFDTEKGYAEKSATKLNTLSSSKVNVLQIHNDTLYAGLDQGIAKLALNTAIEKINFFNPNIWIIDQQTTGPVKSFIIKGNKCIPYAGLSDLYNGQVINSRDSLLLLDTNIIQQMPSKITALKTTDKNECWIGTEENYFYLWNGSSLTQFEIPGPTISLINKIFVDRSGKMWFLPNVNGNNPPWWLGIGSCENDNWKLYNSRNYPAMGGQTDNGDDRAIIQTKDNRIWFGTSGGQVKTYTPSKDSWRIYYVGYYNITSFYSRDYNDMWGKSDAFALDSSGYLWISSWRNNGGALICYDYQFEPDESKTNPREAHYRRFFPGEYNFTCLHADRHGKILAGDESGNLFLFTHNGDPLGSGIQLIKEYKITNAKILDAVTTADDTTRITTSDGLYTLDPVTNEFSKSDDFNTLVRSIEAENDHIIWLGTAGDGLIRYDLIKRETSSFTTANGLISNEIKDLSFDRKNGYLWLATDIGFSKIDIGYQLDKSITFNDVEVFPNPYSKTRMSQHPITIRNVPASGKALIFSVDGRLVANLKPISQENGKLYTWKPASNIIPGTYIVAISAGNKSGTKKLLITP